jgi:DNA (cytosine-5)-methyltransferase 1
MDITQTINYVSLCSGFEGISLGIKRAIPNLRTICYCERESYVIENLLAKIEEGKLDAAPVWTDVTNFPYEEFYGKVDILSAGYPCKPFALVGKRLGEKDPRHLWPFIRDGIKQMQPTICLFENVEGHITMGLSTVISDLEEMGYRTTWGIFSAAECGAPHERKRVFILAILDNPQFKRLERLIQSNLDEERREDESGSASPSDICNWRRVKFADELPKCECCEEEWCEDCGTHYADCKCYGPTQDGLEFIECNGVLYARPESKWPNYPIEKQKEWEPKRIASRGESKLGGEINGSSYRVDRHILLGNGVVPDVAERAFKTLFKRLTKITN